MRLFSIILALFFLFACTKKKYIENEGLIYGTIYHVSYQTPDGKDLHKEIEEILHQLNRSLSTFDSVSIISKINKNEEVELDNHFKTIFKKAMEVSEKTEGAFDITVAPIVNAWGFGFKNKETITDSLIDSLKKITGYKKIRMVDGKIKKTHPETMLDASAIAKGFACDLVGGFLQQNGCMNYMVEIGGEVVARGRNKKAKVWSIGISNPVEFDFVKGQEFKAIVNLRDMALATSGNYRNFYVEDGKKYAHTINPKTAYPVQHELLSATVLADSCITADAYATAFMVLGLEKSIEIIENKPEIEVYFIYSNEAGDFQTFVSRGFEKYLVHEN